jgi:soluble lytic murein transglycosylase
MPPNIPPPRNPFFRLPPHLTSADTLASPAADNSPEQTNTALTFMPISPVPNGLKAIVSGGLALMVIGVVVAGGFGLLPSSFKKAVKVTLSPALSPVKPLVSRLQSWLWGGSQSSTQVFNPQQALSLELARTQYHNALDYLADKQPQLALEALRPLEKAYPALRPLILLHEAEAHAQIPNELGTQVTLKQLINEHSNSSLLPMAWYRLGQSQVRANDNLSTVNTSFSQVGNLLNKQPNSPLALGSLYYKGDLAAKANNTKLAANYWLTYLKNSPDGRFATTILHQLRPWLPHPTPQQHAILGKALVFQPQQSKVASEHLALAPLVDVWYPLASMQYNSKQTQLARQTLLNGLRLLCKQAPSVDQSDAMQAGLRLILMHTPATQQAITLQSLQSEWQTRHLQAQDEILWQLIVLNRDSPKALLAAEALRFQFAKSRYAPECSWLSFWHHLNEGASTIALQQGATHLEAYPYAQSSPRVMYWMAKLTERQGKADLAMQGYERLIQDYPLSYYAMRATGRLEALKGRADTGWHLPAVLLPSGGFVSLPQGKLTTPQQMAIVPLLAELNDIATAGAGGGSRVSQAVLSDMALLVQSVTEPVALSANEQLGGKKQQDVGLSAQLLPAWLAINNGRPDIGIRLVRDELGLLSQQGQSTLLSAYPDAYKLLYPVLYTTVIKSNALRYHLPVSLVLGLIREESYFNPNARSGSDAHGLMQLLPSTAAEVAQQNGQPFNKGGLYSPDTNIGLGSAYLAGLFKRFVVYGPNLAGPLAVGSYNAGAGAVSGWLAKRPVGQDIDDFIEQIPYEQTRDYVKKVFGSAWAYTQLYGGAKTP